VNVDLTKISDALAYAGNGYTISVAAGTYTEDLTMDKGLTLQGAGETAAFLKGAVTIKASNTTITGFSIQPSSQTANSITPSAVADFLIKAQGNSALENLKFSSNSLDGLSIRDYGVIVNNVKTAEISKNTIKSFKKKGVWIRNSSKVTVSKNKVDNNKNDEKTATAVETVEESKEVEVSGNGFENNNTAINADQTSTGIVSKENDFKNNSTDTGTNVTIGTGNDTDKDTEPPKVTHKLMFWEGGKVITASYVKVSSLIQLKIFLTNIFSEIIEKTANTSNITVLLSSTGSGKFYSDVNKTTEISSVTVPANNNYAEFYYLNSTTGSYVATASENPATLNWEDASMTLNVLSSSSSDEIKTVLNNPNPFNPDKESTKIQYDLNEDKDVTVYIYDSTMTLIWQKDYSAGSEGGRSNKVNEITWDGKTYFGDICANDFYVILVIERSTKKLLAKGKIAILK
jgi:parallel beta-helix repeat protein